jgi:UDP-glucuronate 4-epimerase
MSVVLVTGAAGFIGSSLSEYLVQQGHHVVGVDNFDPYYDREIKENNLKALLTNTAFEFHNVDITNADELKRHLPKVDAVIHLAAKVGVLPSLKHPAEYTHTNINGTQIILEWMKENQIRKMIFASSSSVYGNQAKMPFAETDNVDNPISPYAFTKKACELMNHAYHYLYKIDILNLRFFTVFGPRQRPDLAIHKFVKLISEGKPVTMYGEGETARDYTYISDIVQGINAAFNYLMKTEDVFETVNLGNNHPVKLANMVRIISEKMGATPNIKKQPTQPGDVNATYADISKAKSLFGYSPKVSFEDGVSKFIDWWQQNKVVKYTGEDIQQAK